MPSTPDPPAAAEQLLSQACAGSENALMELLETFGPEARRRLSIPPRWNSLLSLDDVMQTAYTEAFLHIGQFQPAGVGSFIRWLATLARNALIDAIRLLDAEKRGGDRVRVSLNPTESASFLLDGILAASSSTPSQKLSRQESLAALQRAIEALPETYRVVVERCDLHGESAESVATALGRTIGAVYMLKSRAHRLLARALGAD